MMHIGNEWDALLADEIQKDYYLKLRQFLISEYTTRRIYPPMEDIFNALRHTSYSDVRAVILGQDPYHGPGQAHGMCFSVKRGTPPPPSLQNIFKEIKSDLGIDPPQHGELTSWADNGVLLLNTVLTVREGQPNSHKGMGWEQFTDRIIQLLNERQQPMVFLLWGGNARSKARLITNPAHLVLQYNAKVAMGSRQLTGLGTHATTYTYVREGYNDFIFAYIGMVFGFIGCMAVVIALSVMCIKLLSDASSAIDPLGKLICVGVFAMFTFHCVINIAMVLSAGPVVGIPLPFVSTGGTSLVMSYASLGPVMSVVSHREKKKHMFYEEKE